jgi:hypothetical protein
VLLGRPRKLSKYICYNPTQPLSFQIIMESHRPQPPVSSSTLLQRQRQHHDQSFNLLNQALDLEQSGRLKEALELYVLGGAELQQAVSLRFPPADW